MNKKNKNTPLIVLTVILAICIVALITVCAVTKNAEENQTEETSSEPYSSIHSSPIIMLAASAIKEYTVITVDENGNENRLCFVRTEPEEEESETSEEVTTEDGASEDGEQESSGIWTWKDKEDFPLNASKFDLIEELLFEFSPSNKIRNVTEEQLREFGLDEPSFSIAINIESQKEERIFRIGKENSYNGSYYLLDESSPEDVYLISADARDTLFCSILDIANLNPFETVYEELMHSVTIQNSDKKVVCSYYSNMSDEQKTDEMSRLTTSWWVSVDDEDAFPLDSSISNNLAALLKGMEFLECHSYTDEELLSYGIDPEDPTVLTFVYTNNIVGNKDETDTVTLWLGNTEEKYGYYYACFPDTNVVFTLGGAAYAKLFEYSEEQLFSMNIADINYNTVESLIIKDTDDNGADRTISIVTDHTENQGTLYTINGVEGNTYTDFSSFINALKSFRATANTAINSEDTPVRDESVSADVIFTIDFVFSDSEETHTLTVSRFNEEYNLVSFMGKETLLVTVDATEALIDEYVEIKAK